MIDCVRVRKSALSGMEDLEKKKRKRMKKICKDIREQMEFYFSDANLHKDRFLKKQIDQSQDGWLNLDLFSRFNKLKQLTQDLQVIAKALNTSELLELSEDGKKVKRKTPICEPKNVDDRTVYVECLPFDADHNWVKSTFSHYGKVVYVSLPKYKTSGDIKGFAFVEFETIEDAKRACEEMNNPPASESDQIGMFPVKGNKDVQRMQKILSTQRVIQGKRGRRSRTLSENEVIHRKEDVREQLRKTTKKRSRLWSQGSGDAEVSIKRLKTSDSKENSSSSSDSSSEEDEPVVKKKKENDKGEVKTSKSVKRKHEEEKGNEGESEEQGVSREKKLKTKTEVQQVAKNKQSDAGEKKKRKKRKKKLKEDKKNIPELRVIPKQEWQTLRNEYIKLQKENMKELKTSLKEIRSKKQHNTGNILVEMEDTESKVQKENIVKAENKVGQLEFVPNVIVHVKSELPLNRKMLKDQLGQFGEIKYIEVLDGDNIAHIRCSTSQTATDIAQANIEASVFTVLSGEDEKQYWDKILSDREKKLSNKSKPKRRGKDKKITKVDQMREESKKKSHVFFDEDT